MIRLLLVDDRELVAQRMRAMLNLESDLEVVGVAKNSRVTIRQMEVLQPDVVLMDIKMPVMDGRETTRIISQRFPNTKVLVVSTVDGDDCISHSIGAGEEYMLEDLPVPKLAQSIRSVYRGSSQTKLKPREEAFDSMINSSNIEIKQPELAELVPKEIEFTWKTALQAANSLIFHHTGEYLSDRETLVLHGAWNNYTYEEIGRARGYTSSYLCKDIGHSLWKNLSTALKVKVSKTNFKAALKREWRKYTQAASSQNRDRLAQAVSPDNIPLFEGLIALDSTLYLERPPIESICDREIRRSGSLIRIEGAKWLGKTSLVNKIIESGNLQGQKTVYLNFEAIEWETIQDLNKLFLWLSTVTSHQLDLENKIPSYWSKNSLGCNDYCTAYFENCVLTKVKSGLVLALDNIDRLYCSPKIAEAFLGMLWDWHERAKHNHYFSHLKIVTTQSTQVNIPFENHRFFSNAVQPIVLEEFDFKRVKTLASFYHLDWNDWSISRLMNEVGGNPYLVRLAMYQAKIQNLALGH